MAGRGADTATGALRRLRAAPMRTRRMRLERAAPDDTHWLAELLNRHPVI
ncbi:hypothetical protein [Micromonospora sp. KC207]|nr:hypothetical protein [Micromonospora sp. KC207]